MYCLFSLHLFHSLAAFVCFAWSGFTNFLHHYISSQNTSSIIPCTLHHCSCIILWLFFFFFARCTITFRLNWTETLFMPISLILVVSSNHIIYISPKVLSFLLVVSRDVLWIVVHTNLFRCLLFYSGGSLINTCT